jgi:hypothetical protein
MNIKLSHSGRYIMFGKTLHDLSINESYNIEDLSFHFWINFLKENTIGTYKNGVKDLSELNNFLRETVYSISNLFNGKIRDSFIFEYELKYSNKLLKENIEDYKEHIENIWRFVESNLELNGLTEQSLLDKAKSAISKTVDYIKQKGLPWVMENLRSALFSWGGAAVQTFLGTVGAPYGGNIALWVVWGAMLAYDIYEAIQGRPNYFNIIIDIISIATFGVGGKVAVEAFKKLGISSGPITKNLPQFLSKISKSPIGPWFAKTIGSVGRNLGNVISYLGKGVTYAGEKLGLQTIKKSGSSITSWAKDFISKLTINPTIKKLAPTAATAGIVAGINKATGQNNQVFSGSFGQRGDEIYAQSQGLPTQQDFEDLMSSTNNIDADYTDLFKIN